MDDDHDQDHTPQATALPTPTGPTLRDLCQQAVDDGRYSSLHELALEAGMAPETLSRLLAGRMRQPGHLLLVGLATALGSDIGSVSDALLRQMHGARS